MVYLNLSLFKQHAEYFDDDLYYNDFRNVNANGTSKCF